LFWFSALFIIVQKYAKQINQRTFNLIELLGRNSLLVYIVHAFVVFAFKLYIPQDSTFAINFLITAAALFCLFAGTILYKMAEPLINKSINNFKRRLNLMPA
jgi:fucose 4-O-acetylase-like acetyltransferase